MKIAVRILIALAGLVVLVALFYVEEDWRGKRAWEKCKQDLEARGEVLDWNKFIPPPVPDEQNFFKAPKMAEWFVKINGQFTNELTARLNHPDTTAVTIGGLTVLPPATNVNASTENADIALRYSSFGKAVFLSAPIETNMSSPNVTIPLIQFEDVPLITAIENLARQAGISYSLDPKIGYGQPDENGEIKPEPVMSLRWENITARQALLAVLNKFDLQLMDEPNATIAHITMKASGTPELYVASDVREKMTQLFQNAIGANAIGWQGFALLVKPLHQIKPIRIVLYSEKMPDEKEVAAIGMEFFPGNLAKIGSLIIRVEPAGTNLFRIVAISISTADYLKWSDSLEPDFDRIREALQRPYARMEGDYANPFKIPIPNFIAVRTVAQTLDQRAKCYLLLGQPEKALREVTLIHDMCRLLECAPTSQPMTLVSAMINVAVTGLYVNTVAEGIHNRTWQEPQLAALQKQLGQINLSRFLVEAIHEERAGVCEMVEKGMLGKIEDGGHSNLMRGWMYQNLVNITRLDQEAIDSIDYTNNFIFPEKADKVQRELDAIGQHGPFTRPYSFFAAIAVPSFAKAFQVLGQNQTLANEAQVACALERFHLAHGEYPETLDALMPQFIEKLPHDIIGGQPLHYHRTTDGKFLLYSVGWNETDDGGQVVSKKDGSEDRENGDWVWQYPVK